MESVCSLIPPLRGFSGSGHQAYIATVLATELSSSLDSLL